MSTDVFGHELSADFTAQLHLLRDKYFDRLKEKEMELEDIIANVAAYGLDKPTLSGLYLIVHNIVGAAPTHGFHDVAGRASEAEKVIQGYLRLRDLSNCDMDILFKLEDLTREIRVTLKTCPSV